MIWWIVKIISGGAPMAWLWWVITHDADGTAIGALGEVLRLFGLAIGAGVAFGAAAWFAARWRDARIVQRRADLADAVAGRRAPVADVES